MDCSRLLRAWLSSARNSPVDQTLFVMKMSFPMPSAVAKSPMLISPVP